MTGKRKATDLGISEVWERVVAMLRADDYDDRVALTVERPIDYRTCPTRACRTMIPLTVRQASPGQLVFCPRCGEPLGLWGRAAG